MIPYTPTHRRILAILEDGKGHSNDELHKALDDELTSKKALNVHICSLRKMLRIIGEDIVCDFQKGLRNPLYRHVRDENHPVSRVLRTINENNTST